MLVVGLTGGIAAGKSTVAGLLRDAGAEVIDADRVARELVQPGLAAFEQIRERFGGGVVSTDGHIDRGALGAIVFEDPVARRDLNAILHPRIFAAISDSLSSAPPDQVVVVEAALLTETYDQAVAELGMQVLVVVEAPVEHQLRRLVEQRGLDDAQAAARLRAQATPAERRARADILIDNSGSAADLRRQVEGAWVTLRELARRT